MNPELQKYMLETGVSMDVISKIMSDPRIKGIDPTKLTNQHMMTIQSISNDGIGVADTIRLLRLLNSVQK
jgi:hypothetical protein